MEGKTIFIADVNTGKSSLILEPSTPRHYLIPFSVERVNQIIRDFPPTGDPNNTGLTLLKLGESNPIGVKSLEEFCEPFMTVWDRYRNPKPGAQFSVKEIVSEIHKQSIAAGEEHGAYQ